MSQAGGITLRLGHEQVFQKDPLREKPASVSEVLTSEEQAALSALRSRLARSSEDLGRIVRQIRGPACGW